MLTLRAPHRGPAGAAGPIFVICAQFTLAQRRDMARALAGALPLWGRWHHVPGAIALSFRVQPAQRRAWMLSAWQTRSDLDQFVASPAHRAVVLAFAPRLTGPAPTVGWHVDQFRMRRDWRTGIASLPH